MLLELAHDVGHRRCLLADRDIDTDQVLPFLVDNSVDGERRLAGLAITDDQLALTPADRHHGVDGLETGLHRLRHRLACDHAGRDLLERRCLRGLERASAIDGPAKRIDHAADQRLAHRHLHNAAGAANAIALGDVLIVADNHGPHGVALEIQGQPIGIAREFDHFALHHAGQAVNARDTVGQTDDDALGAGLWFGFELLDFLLDQLADF